MIQVLSSNSGVGVHAPRRNSDQISYGQKDVNRRGNNLDVIYY